MVYNAPGFLTYRAIHKNHGDDVDTDMLSEFISTYGVNHVDDYDVILISGFNSMSYEQIDMILAHRSNILYMCPSYKELRTPFLFGIPNDKLIYILEKMFEYDHDFAFVTHKMHFNYCDDRKFVFTFLEYWEYVFSNDAFYVNTCKEAMIIVIQMLKNHLKRYQTLFMLMVDEIDIDKKRRIQ